MYGLITVISCKRDLKFYFFEIIDKYYPVYQKLIKVILQHNNYDIFLPISYQDIPIFSYLVSQYHKIPLLSISVHAIRT